MIQERSIIETRICNEPVFANLVSTSLAEGFRFVQRLVDDWAKGTNRFDAAGEVLFIALARKDVAAGEVDDLAPPLIGVCGLNVDPDETNLHLGRVRHLYILPKWRRIGSGRRLMAEVIRAARAADLFYTASGFAPVYRHSTCTPVMHLRKERQHVAVAS